VDLDDLTHAQSAVAALLGSLAPDEWSRPSPCSEWGVLAVVRHLHVGERAFATSLGGTPYDLAALTAEVSELPIAELPAAYAAGAAALRAALAAADPAGAFPTGLGPMSPVAIDRLRTVEALVHGWDVARGTGRPLTVDDAAAERAIAHSLALMERLPPDRKPFAPPVEIGDAAPAIDRLAALLGRSWPSA
jgi:uncharacterized protein (TIGR03086 family)